jgi:hypothetical protein
MLTLTSWNDAAAQKTKSIFGAVEDNLVVVAGIRQSFERLSTSYFRDTAFDSTETKTNVHALWREVGAKAIKWGKSNNIDITPDALVSTLIRKQRDYGHHNIAKYGRQGLIIRVHDKLARLENLTKSGTIVSAQNEPISDTVLDIAGYSAIGMMWEHDLFLLPLV